MWKNIRVSLSVVLIIFVSGLSYGQSDDDVKLANEYYARGELEKAKSLYEEIARDMTKVNLIHNNYFFLLLNTQDYKIAEKYLDRLIKRNPSNLYYKLDKGRLLKAMAKEGTADKYFKSIIDQIVSNPYLTRHASTYFVNNQLSSYAIQTFEKSRKVLGNDKMYSLEMANLFRIENMQERMVEEYLNYIIANPNNSRYVKNTLGNLLTETKELESLENLLYERIQKEPENITYSDLLIWVNLQLKNFYGAFIQARAIDRRLNKPGDKSVEIGTIALRNDDYTNASKIFNYVIQTYPNSINYIKSKMYLIQAYELRVKNTFPVSEEEIRKVIADYHKLINELGIDRNTLEALRNKALLHAFYLDERDSAITILNQIVGIPRANRDVKSKSKLDLGDIYLLNEEPWESTLLYSQVEKEMKDTPIGYEAKLRNAKLSYFKGDFLLAEEHLDIIKKATTREISNDAISLSLLIKDNIAMDSTEEAMREYAAIELLLFQNKDDEALVAIDSMKSRFRNHSLTDELLWLQADMLLKRAEFENSVRLLSQIMEGYNYDILADDAYFRMGEIYERHLDNKEKAMEIYIDFLSKFPGSVYAAEARKRFRTLRGDFDHLEEEDSSF